MLFVLRFTDKPDALTVRAQHLADHLLWLNTHKETVLVAGALRASPDDTPVGACWIVDAPDRSAVETLLASDPFYTHGLRHSVEILHWTKALPHHIASI